MVGAFAAPTLVLHSPRACLRQEDVAGEGPDLRPVRCNEAKSKAGAKEDGLDVREETLQ